MARRSRFEVRLSDAEAARLDEGRGPMSRAEFFRKLLDAWAAQPDTGAPRPLEEEPHRHRRGAELDPVWENGIRRRRWLCDLGCGHILTS